MRCTGVRALGAGATTGGEKCAACCTYRPRFLAPRGVVGGGERAAYGLARGVAREIPTTLVSFGAERASQQHGELSVEIYPSAGDLGGQPFDPFSCRFLALVRKADVVHCSHYRVAVSQLAILAGAAMGKRTFVTDRGGVGVHFDPRLPVERCVTALLPISRFSLAHLPQGVPARVIPGGATERFVSETTPARETRPGQTRRVLYVGRIMRHKGIDVLVRGLPMGSAWTSWATSTTRSISACCSDSPPAVT